MTIKCGCGKDFLVTETDATYFKAKGWAVPRRCRHCRWARRPLIGGLYHPLGGEHQLSAIANERRLSVLPSKPTIG